MKILCVHNPPNLHLYSSDRSSPCFRDQKSFTFDAESSFDKSHSYNDSGQNCHYYCVFGQIYVVKNIVQLLWKVFNYVLNYALLGNVRVHCCLFCSFYLLKLLPGLKLLLSTNKCLWG